MFKTYIKIKTTRDQHSLCAFLKDTGHILESLSNSYFFIFISENYFLAMDLVSTTSS